MPYLIGDRSISFADFSLSPQDQLLINAHRHIFRVCLNSATHKYLLSTKRIVHLFTDIVTIYSTLLLKVQHYEDLRILTNKTKVGLTRLESDLNSVFGPGVELENEGWEHLSHEPTLKKLALEVLASCTQAFDVVFRTLSCIEVFFELFDNLKKLLVPSLLSHTQMIQKLLANTTCLFLLPTIVNQVEKLPELTPMVVKQMAKIDSITCGVEREAKLLDVIFLLVDPSLQEYTLILLGRAILKQDVGNHECLIITRREVCYRAAEHVMSIPLSSSVARPLLRQYFSRHLVYLYSAVLVAVIAVLYGLYNVIFG